VSFIFSQSIPSNSGHYLPMKKIHSLAFAIATVASLTLIVGTTNSFAASAKPTPKASTKPMPAPKPTGLANPTPAPGAQDGQGGGRGFGGGRGGLFANLTDANRACLTKNGFTIPVRPTDAPTARPTFSPGARPSFSPGQGGANGGGRGFGGGNFDPTVMQKAFAACGIAAPQFGNRDGQPNAQPSMAPNGKTPTKAVAPVNPKQAAFIKCMTAAGIKNSGAALAYDQSDPDTALALIKCQKSSGFTLPKK
jgi:hypothetical protein